MDCPHVNTTKLIEREATHERCDDCGAVRTTFVVEPNMKDGQTFAFRSKDWAPGPVLGPPQHMESTGTLSLREMIELLGLKR